jgi:peptidoglycan hydrolase-like protein with peptidoglycan-binding domain
VPAAAGLVLIAAGCGGDGNTPATATAEAGTTATVERMDLVDRESLDGTLGYADTGRLAAGVAGTLTGLREPGAVITRGHSLYDVDGAAAAFLMYGELPAWRDFEPGMAKGADVRQLERNLRALGHDPGTVDRTWTAATTAAVLRFQRARGLTEDGTLVQGEIVFRPGETRIGEAKAEVGQRVQPGAELAELASTRREVTVELPADRQELVRAGDAVTVELPTGREGRGRIAEVGKVAQTAGEEGAEPTITVRVSLRGRAARGTGLDQAPVDVGFARERRRGVLAVPVTALVARAGGGFAVEAVEPSGRRVVPVEAGLYADDYVEVSGRGLREGMRVVSAE